VASEAARAGTCCARRGRLPEHLITYRGSAPKARIGPSAGPYIFSFIANVKVNMFV